MKTMKFKAWFKTLFSLALCLGLFGGLGYLLQITLF